MLKESLLEVEKCDAKNQSIHNSSFTLPYNYVFYFEKENDVEFNLYIRQNIESLKESFRRIGKNFVYLPLAEDLDFNLISVLEYYSPQVAYNNLAETISKEFSKIHSEMLAYKLIDLVREIHGESSSAFRFDYKLLLQALGYTNNINSGLVINGFETFAVGVSDNFRNFENKDFGLFFSEIFNLISALKSKADSYCFLPKLEVSSEQLDDDAKAVVKDLEEKLNKLQDSGQLLFLIPVLRDVLDKQVEKLDFSTASKIQIDTNNKIWLPDFYKEVELSHLTKSIYFLFLKHPEGINLRELFKYRNELLNIYTSVSNQLDFDKMTKSIDDVVNVETKSIYTHISRIKSAFYKLMDVSYADYYIVSGHGEEDRKVLINPSCIKWAEVNTLDDFFL